MEVLIDLNLGCQVRAVIGRTLLIAISNKERTRSPASIKNSLTSLISDGAAAACPPTECAYRKGTPLGEHGLVLMYICGN